VQLKIRVKYLRELQAVHPSDVVDAVAKNKLNDVEHIEAERLTDEQLDWLYDRARSTKDPATNRYEEGAVGLSDKISSYRKVKANPAGHKVTNPEALVSALYEYIRPSEHKWLFNERADSQMVPFFVKDVTFHPTEAYSPAHTKVKLVSVYRGNHQEFTLNYDAGDLRGGVTVPNLLAANGYYLETPEMVERYEQEADRYLKIRDLTGHQFRADGPAFLGGDNRWASGMTDMTRDGLPTKVVMDDVAEEKGRSRWNENDVTKQGREREKASSVATSFWAVGTAGPKKKYSHRSTDEDDTAEVFTLPVQPYVTVFDLQKHQFVDIHVNGLTEYAYDKSVIDKLILPETTKDLIMILVEGAGRVMDDIIAGKTGGIIVLATGEPGVGKTLSAEVASEELEKPLYVVQCSQLGTNEEVLEVKLSRVLERATRWGAILLIDEADVYIHERGEDIQQNAIVGVFLRVLEYYRGILFMTSNRATIIDDAIMSRATAWVQYPLPGERIREIWRVLSMQFKMHLSEKDVEIGRASCPAITGRNVKSLLKLAKLLADARRKEVTPELVRYVSQFQKLSGMGEETT
jgi:hypothetical protein